MKPMLAATTDGSNLTYPLFASPKLDGIRALVIDGKVVSRSLKPIPNRHVQVLFGKKRYNGLDGELIVGDLTADNCFQTTSSGVMSIEGNPKVGFHVFDDFSRACCSFENRLKQVDERTCRETQLIFSVYHVKVENEEELLTLETRFFKQGFEGIILRAPEGQYKYGRSTMKQGWLLKMKRFEDSEACVTGADELMSNTNEAKLNELGYKERSSKGAGKVSMGRLGALSVRDLKTGVEFNIGTGFTEQQRKDMWYGRRELIGCVVKYKYQSVGVKEKPRFPVFLGFRDGRDL